MNIEKERAVLQGKLSQLQARLDQIKAALFAADDQAIAPAAKVKPPKAVTAAKAAPAAKTAHQPKKKKAAGELKPRILQALAAAGKSGIRVRDLAEKLGITQPALNSWFQFARTRIKAIRKVSKGRYRLDGPIPVEAPAAGTPATAKPAE